MFQYTFSTVYMAVLASNILLIVLTMCFRNKKLMVNVGYRLLALFIIFTLVRVVFPFELPFTKTILLPEWISAAITRIRHVWFTVGKLDISIWMFLQCIWLIGFIVKLIQYIRLQAKTRYHILANSLDATTEEPYQTLLTQICAEKNRKNSFQILRVSGLKVPLLYGMFSPCILIPEDLELSEEDWYYVLAHEVSHHFHHDLITKTIVRLIDMIYWWNPFCRVLVEQTDIVLEMRIDDVITLSDTHTIKGYLKCLLKLAEHNVENSSISSAVTMPLLTSTEEQLTKRFEMLVASSDQKKHSLNIVLLLSVVGIYLLSYAIIFEAHYVSPEIEETTIAPSADNTYAILREDNTYDVYYGDILIENTDSLEFFPGVPVYTEKEYHNEKQ